MKKPVYGFGINDADYLTSPRVNGRQVECKIYRTWKSMLRRCYSKNSLIRNPTYSNCTVDGEWHSFMAFRSWMMQQDWEGKDLDKDLIVQGNRVYSKINCIFIDRKINNIINASPAKNGNLPVGTSLHRRTKKYQADYRHQGATKYLGLFDTPMEAHAFWQKAKAENIEQAANEQTDLRIKNALMLRVNQLRDDMANGRETVKL